MLQHKLLVFTLIPVFYINAIAIASDVAGKEDLINKLDRFLSGDNFDESAALELAEECNAFDDREALFNYFKKWLELQEENAVEYNNRADIKLKQDWFTKLVYSVTQTEEERIQYAGRFAGSLAVRFNVQSIQNLLNDSVPIRKRIMESFSYIFRHVLFKFKRSFFAANDLEDPELFKVKLAICKERIENFTPMVIKALEDEDASIKLIALDALAFMCENNDVVAEAVVKLIDYPEKAVKKRAISVLSHNKSAKYLDCYYKLLDSDDASIKISALVALSHQKTEREDIIEKITGLIDNSDVEIQYWAINAAGGLRIKRLESKIAGYLNDDNEKIRVCSISYLTYLKANKYKNEIAKLLADPVIGVRITAIDALSRFNCNEFANEIAELAKQARDVKEIHAIISALGNFQIKDYAKYIVPFLSIDDVSVRYYALLALEKLEAKEYIEELRKLLKDYREKGVGIHHRDGTSEYRVTRIRQEARRILEKWGFYPQEKDYK